MFVCLGNICRSPMAELLLKDMVKKAGREEEFIIQSSATASDNVWNGVGAPVYSHIRPMPLLYIKEYDYLARVVVLKSILNKPFVFEK